MANRHALVGTLKNWEAARSFQIDFLKRQGLTPHHYLLDFGCGTLRGGVPIIEYLEPGHYIGVDCRPEVLAEAELELREHHLEGKIGGLFTNLPGPIRPDFDFIWCFSVFLHINNKKTETLFDAFAHMMLGAEKGRIFMNVNTHPVTPTHWGEFPVMWHAVGWYIDIARRSGLTTISHGTLAGLGYDAPDPESGAQEMLEFKL